MDIKNNIKNIYSNKLKSIFKTCNDNKEFSRIEVRIIHNEEDLCINAEEREILHSIQNVLGKYWYFKESLLGKCIFCNFRYVSNNPDFNNIYPEYKKEYMIRMNMITEQYNYRLNISSYYSAYESQYKTLKKRINILKKDTIPYLKKTIYKIPLNQDVCSLIYEFSKENLKTFLTLRNDVDTFRNNIKNIIII